MKTVTVLITKVGSAGDITPQVKEGPFRDRTDAENAAEDYARSHDIELQWCD